MLFACGLATAQVNPPTIWKSSRTTPSGNCAAGTGVETIPGGVLYTCQNGTWTQVSGGGGASIAPFTTDGTNVALPSGTLSVGNSVLSPKGNSITVSATGANDQVQINAAITRLAATTESGGTVILSPGIYSLSASIVPAKRIKLIGTRPGLTNFDTPSNEHWTLNGTGTVLQCTSTAFSAIAYNNVPQATPTNYNAENYLSHAEFSSFGITGCLNGIDIGAQNSPGLAWGKIENVYSTTNAGWGVHLENFAESDFVHIQTSSNGIGEQWFASTVRNTTYEPGNSTFSHLYASALSAFARCIVFAAPGADGTNYSMLASIKVYSAQCNRFRNAVAITQTVTPSNGSTAIAVTDLTKFSVGIPIWFSTTADGFTAARVYFVTSVSGTTGAGSITVGLTMMTTAANSISASASTALTSSSYGFPGLELVGNPNTTIPSTVVGSSLNGLDIERASIAVYMENATVNQVNIVVGAYPANGYSFVLRNSAQNLLLTYFSGNYDVDGVSGTSQFNGLRATATQRLLPGIYQDVANGVTGINFNSGPVSAPPNLYFGNNFLVPFTSIGETLFARDTSITFTGATGGAIIFNGAAGQTFTLPIIDNGSTLVASFLGIRYKIVNVSTNTLTVATQSSQTLNNSAGVTSIVLAAGDVREFTAAKTTGGVLFWLTIPRL